ncbi:unnamed protein product [Cyprideis torosa]|uniref:Bestrophin homolog n=1 Tax=Cyprideis torosa TaxID=163714 RepID=A0A7R8W2A6_9CRUS|nr:unnamed protein product [Cyprideis torosa]CAG0881734.1 unnamed protein product [Cyprideis torosa]
MTVSYTQEVATARRFGIFWKLLFKFRGSLLKLIFLDYALFMFCYCLISFLYRNVLDEDQRKWFESVSMYASYYANSMPIVLILGFYVNNIVPRWWNQYMNIPWPDDLAICVSANLRGMDDRGRLLRRTIMRYINLSYILCMRRICSRVKKRFPTLQHLVEAGILESKERSILIDIEEKNEQIKYWVPIVWATDISHLAYKENRLGSGENQNIINRLIEYRKHLGVLLGYDRNSFPLLYSQVITVSVYSYFIAGLIARQWLDPEMKYPKHSVDLYFPFFTTLQFFTYMGYLRPAEVMINPFGEDDDDFEINSLIDRNLRTSYLIADEMHGQHPDLVEDAYWSEPTIPSLPHTKASEAIQEKTPVEMGSTACIAVDDSDAMISSRFKMRSMSLKYPLRGPGDEETPSPGPGGSMLPLSHSKSESTVRSACNRRKLYNRIFKHKQQMPKRFPFNSQASLPEGDEILEVGE